MICSRHQEPQPINCPICAQVWKPSANHGSIVCEECAREPLLDQIASLERELASANEAIRANLSEIASWGRHWLTPTQNTQILLQPRGADCCGREGARRGAVIRQR